MPDTSTTTGAGVFVSALEQYGVEYLFGNPGTTELPVMAALDDSPIEYILGLHEDIAVATAAGYASTRRYHAHRDQHILPAGVVNLHVAPGLAHGLGNLYNAQRGGVPLVVTAGQAETDHLHDEPILSGDLERMARQFTKWSAEVPSVDALPGMVRRAFRTALTPPTGPVFLALPLDTMLEPTTMSPERLGPIPDAGRGDPDAIDRATALLVDAEDPVMIVGDHVARAGAVKDAIRFAEAAGLRVHGEILTAEVNFPTTHDQWASFVPTNEADAREAMATDTLCFVGCSTHTTVTKPTSPLVSDETTCIHIGPGAWELGKHEPADATIIGDPGHVLAELATQLEAQLSESQRTARLNRVKTAAKGFATAPSPSSDDPRMAKHELVQTIADVAPDAYIVDEGVTSKYVMFETREFDSEGFLGNKGGGLGYGLGASIGAAIAERDGPGRDVIGFVGDGSYLYYPQAVYTAVRYDLDLTVVIPDNRNYRILKDNMLSLLGGDEADYSFTGMDFDPPIDIPANAETLGAKGALVESTADLREALVAARAETGPTVLDVLVHD